MNKLIVYRKADYQNRNEKKEIIRLYKEIFNVDISEQYNLWFSKNPYGEPLGVVAVDKKKIVGHFAAVMLLVSINGQVYNFRMSMGFMTDACYRGNGIATNLYKKLKQEIIAEGKALFIIGFPNDVSVKMHLTKMEYSLCREFQFVKLPYKKQSRKFRKINIEEIGNKKIIRHPYNMVVHDSEYIKWRFNSQKYTSYVSDDKKYFICTKFKNKVDLLYWDSTVDEKDILELAGFLYDNENIESVETWNTTGFLNKYCLESRKYHMCINYLDLDDEVKKMINRNWIFYMSDCELF